MQLCALYYLLFIYGHNQYLTNQSVINMNLCNHVKITSCKLVFSKNCSFPKNYSKLCFERALVPNHSEYHFGFWMVLYNYLYDFTFNSNFEVKHGQQPKQTFCGQRILIGMRETRTEILRTFVQCLE